MKTTLAVLAAALAALAGDVQDAAADSPPASTVALRLPDSSLDLELRYRQITDDVSRYVEPEGADAQVLRQLRVQAVLAQGIDLSSDVGMKIGERRLPAGRYRLGFTIDRGEATRWFLVAGAESIAVPFEPVEMPFDAPRLTITPRYVDGGGIRWLWHLGERAGEIETKLDVAAR